MLAGAALSVLTHGSANADLFLCGGPCLARRKQPARALSLSLACSITHLVSCVYLAVMSEKLVEDKAPASGFQLFLHPLVILDISDAYTRAKMGGSVRCDCGRSR